MDDRTMYRQSMVLHRAVARYRCFSIGEMSPTRLIRWAIDGALRVELLGPLSVWPPQPLGRRGAGLASRSVAVRVPVVEALLGGVGGEPRRRHCLSVSTTDPRLRYR